MNGSFLNGQSCIKSLSLSGQAYHSQVKDQLTRTYRGWMALEWVVDLSQVLQLGNWNQTGLGPGGVQDGSSVALGQNESVIGWMLGLLGRVLHGVEEEDAEDISHGAA